MKKIKLLITSLIISVFCITSSFADLNFSGKVGTDIAASLPWTKNPGSIVIGDVFVDGKLDYYNGNSSAVVDASLKYDIVKAMAPENTVDFVSGLNAFKGKIKEAYFDYNGGWWAIRAGRQISMWGAGDNFIVTNVLCPTDQSSVSSLEVTDSMLGIDAIKLSFNTDVLLIDAYWIPFFTPSALPLDKGNPLKKILIPSSASIPGMGSVTIKDFSDSDISKPELSLASGEYALRLSAYFPFADFSLYGFYGWEDSPLVSYQLGSSDIALKGEYKRLAMVGFDSSIPAGPVTIRMEGAFYPRRWFETSAESQMKDQLVQKMTTGTINYSSVTVSEQHEQLCGLIGFDWMPGDWTISAQYFADYVFGDVSNLSRKAFDHKASLSAGYSFLGGNLEVSVAGIVDFVDFDSAVVAKVSYAFTDQLKFALEGYILNAGPEKDGTYGKLKDYSCAKLSAAYSF